MSIAAMILIRPSTSSATTTKRSNSSHNIMLCLRLALLLLLVPVKAFPNHNQSRNVNSKNVDVLLFRVSFRRSSNAIQVTRTSVSKKNLPLMAVNDDTQDVDNSNPATAASVGMQSWWYRWLGRGYGGIALGQVLFLLQAPSLRLPLRNVPTMTGTIAGYVIASRLCGTILHQNRESTSPTYLRLHTWGLGLFSAFQLPAIYPSLPATVLATVVRLATLALVVRKIQQQQQAATATSSTSWRVQHKRRALTYRNCAILFLLCMFACIMQGNFQFRYRGSFATWTSWWPTPQWEGLSRFALLATMAYTLKDAAERQRLSGTTFIRLNQMVGSWALAVALGQFMDGSMAHWGREMVAMAVPFWLGAYRGIREKRQIASKVAPMAP